LAYPDLSLDIYEKVCQKKEQDYQANKGFLNGISKKIRSIYSPETLEHMIVIDSPMIGTHRDKELADMGLFSSVSLDREQPVEDIKDNIKDKEEKKKEEQKPYDEIKTAIKKEDKTKPIPLKKHQYLDPPFFGRVCK